MDDQDWTPVVVKRSSRTSGSAPTHNSSRIITPRVHNSDEANHARKLEAMEIGKPKSLSPESRNEIVQKRIALGKNQVQLNQDCRFPVNTIRDIENGRMCPSIQQLNILNRVLKSSLKFAI
jgi:ribosome-binding protein aMBF1 (putative translation factor)